MFANCQEALGCSLVWLGGGGCSACKPSARHGGRWENCKCHHFQWKTLWRKMNRVLSPLACTFQIKAIKVKFRSLHIISEIWREYFLTVIAYHSERLKAQPSYFSAGKLPLVTSQLSQVSDNTESSCMSLGVRRTFCQQVSAGSCESHNSFWSCKNIEDLWYRTKSQWKSSPFRLDEADWRSVVSGLVRSRRTKPDGPEPQWVRSVKRESSPTPNLSCSDMWKSSRKLHPCILPEAIKRRGEAERNYFFWWTADD